MEIDVKKKYKTRDGRRVVNLYVKPYNEIGEKVTYPVKGTIVTQEKPFDGQYMIWCMDGKADSVWPERLAHLDLVPM